MDLISYVNKIHYDVSLENSWELSFFTFFAYGPMKYE